MNEWPENLVGVDVDGKTFENIALAIKTALFALLLTSSVGLAQAAGLDEMANARLLQLGDAWSTWFADGAVGGFDAAGAFAGGW
ncbi:MAG TPA: hypothetical protein VFV39_11295 [Limnobacter sp.]|nr:hypothetical protein [Limnobacter sp.]